MQIANAGRWNNLKNDSGAKIMWTWLMTDNENNLAEKLIWKFFLEFELNKEKTSVNLEAEEQHCLTNPESCHIFYRLLTRSKMIEKGAKCLSKCRSSLSITNLLFESYPIINRMKLQPEK